MLDTVAKILEWVDQYGADKVFMVFFFVLYWRANKKIEKIQDARLTDGKEALSALIEAKHCLDELEKTLEEIREKVESCPRKGTN